MFVSWWLLGDFYIRHNHHFSALLHTPPSTTHPTMADVQSLARVLQASLDPKHRIQAELELQSNEKQPGFSLILLQTVASPSLETTTRLAAALFFKNFLRRSWVDPDTGKHILPAEEVNTIKSELIGLMVTVPESIQAQLGDAISIIADSDFWEQWNTLVDDLVVRFSDQGDSVINRGVLTVAHSIFRRWEPLYRSDQLYTEINHVLSKFASPFLNLWQSTDEWIQRSEGGTKETLTSFYVVLELILQLVYDLSTHDLPPQFEENLPAIASLLHKYLTYTPASLVSNEFADAGPLENVRAGVFRVLVLWTKKYEEEFRPHMEPFIGTSWNLLTGLGPEAKNDGLVSLALEFLTTVVGITTKVDGDRRYADTFNDADVLRQVTEKVVIPNLSLRDSDTDTFDEEPIEFIRQDLEGSDEGSRRRAATNFLRTLMEQFEELVTQVVMGYVTHFLQNYLANQKDNWKDKDTAVHLFSSIAAKGTSTAAKGVLSTNPHASVVDFFQSTIASDLTSNNAHPILKVGAIKYLYTFRSVLSPEQWQAAFPLLTKHLEYNNYVVYTYAAIAVDRALYLTNPATREPIIPRASSNPYAHDTLVQLFKLITASSAPERIQENEYLIKCVMRVLVTLGPNLSTQPAILELTVTNLINITKVIRHNPSNPTFCYYHFESLGALIRFAGPDHPQKLELALFPVFGEILAGTVDEFRPYVFQLLALMVSTQGPRAPLSEIFSTKLLPGILDPTLWESRGNVPALTRLLIALLPKAADTLLRESKLEAVLLLFQKLIATKRDEPHAMDLLDAIVTSIPPPALATYWQPILSLLFVHLNTPARKTDALALRFTRFYHLVSASTEKGYGADFFIAQADKVQEGVFTPIYTGFILPSTQRLVRPLDRKVACISLTRTLAGSEAFFTRYAKRGWTITCQALLQLLINPPLPPTAHDDVVVEERDTEDLSFGAAFTQLNTCRAVGVLGAGMWPEVGDVREWVGKTLREADLKGGGRVGVMVREKLDQSAREGLGKVMGG